MASNPSAIKNYYILPLINKGIPEQEIEVLTYYGDSKISVPKAKEYAKDILERSQGKYIYITNSAYYQALTGSKKPSSRYGYVDPCILDKGCSVVLGVSYQTLIYDPKNQEKLDLSLEALSNACTNQSNPLGLGIIKTTKVGNTVKEVASLLEELKSKPMLTVDIETYGLKHNTAGIATIAMAWNKHEGVVFTVDYLRTTEEAKEVRKLLRTYFLETVHQPKIYHNCTFDIKVLIYNLFMENDLDNTGLLLGLETLTTAFEDTRIIAYLATNSTAGNSLGLKDLAYSYTGNYALDEIQDITSVSLDKLLRYNLIDCLATWYVYKKYYPIMVTDQQEDLYKGLMKDSLKLIIQMELTGMPMIESRIQEVKEQLEGQANDALSIINTHPLILDYITILQEEAMVKANAKLKKKQHPIEHFKHITFNPRSIPNLRGLLYDVLNLPVIDVTEKGKPATGADTLVKLLVHVKNDSHRELLQAIVDLSKVNKILSAFIPAFEEGINKEDGRKWLHGNFNLGGTVSGRLSSSKPNLQQIPSNSTYGKLIKTIFSAPDGWIFAGADFNALEDYISALTTKDPNKLKVYLEGYDGHCLRAYSYFYDSMPDIEDTVESINSIKKKYPELRQESKGATFALTYQGTWKTLVTNLGFSEEKATAIEKGYHELYKVSDEYVQGKLQEASEKGYVTVAFGLRVRTPVLKQVIYGSDTMPSIAAAEGRTAGNALGQSYGLLNNRAAVAFMKKVWNSPFRNDIKPVSLIHDAIYILIKDDLDVVEWANRELINEMKWQELPEIQHDKVKLGAALDLFYPDWSHAITLPNDASKEKIREICNKALETKE